MADFSHLSKLEVKGTAELELYQLGGDHTLIMSPATEANKGYINAKLRFSGKSVRRMKAGNLNADMLEEGRENDRKLFAEYVIKGWRGVVDAKGKDVTFTKENVKSFLAQIPGWLMDEIRNFASDPQNFVEDLMDAEELAKN